jgi:hypothetical protein
MLDLGWLGRRFLTERKIREFHSSIHSIFFYCINKQSLKLSTVIFVNRGINAVKKA